VTENPPGQSPRIWSANGLPVVPAPAEVDGAGSDQLRHALIAAVDDHAIVVVDMSANTFCDSSGIGALLTAARRATARGGELRVVMPDTSVFRVFKLTGADRVLRIFGSVAEAATAGAALPQETR
jgi:anti-sigma B factor antagonist